MRRLPARELENSDPFGLGIIRTAQNCKYSAHDEEEEEEEAGGEKLKRIREEGDRSKKDKERGEMNTYL